MEASSTQGTCGTTAARKHRLEGFDKGEDESDRRLHSLCSTCQAENGRTIDGGSRRVVDGFPTAAVAVSNIDGLILAYMEDVMKASVDRSTDPRYKKRISHQEDHVSVAVPGVGVQLGSLPIVGNGASWS